MTDAGWLTPGFPLLSILTGNEQANFDTELSGGQYPQTAALSLLQIAQAVKWLGASASKTMVAGSRYYSSVTLGNDTELTGIGVLVGGTGGTDKWIVELHDSSGAIVATSDTSGTTAGGANGWQRIAFTAPVTVKAGEYFLAVQSNGTTATLGVYEAPDVPVLTGSATGTFGTGAAITPPTTYTASVGPIALVY